MCSTVKGRKVKEVGEAVSFGNLLFPYGDLFEAENEDTGLQNVYFLEQVFRIINGISCQALISNSN